MLNFQGELTLALDDLNDKLDSVSHAERERKMRGRLTRLLQLLHFLPLRRHRLLQLLDRLRRRGGSAAKIRSGELVELCLQRLVLLPLLVEKIVRFVDKLSLGWRSAVSSAPVKSTE